MPANPKGPLPSPLSGQNKKVTGTGSRKPDNGWDYSGINGFPAARLHSTGQPVSFFCFWVPLFILLHLF